MQITYTGRQTAAQFVERLERRYTSAVKQLARELGIVTARKSKATLSAEIGEMLATGYYPQVVIDWNLYG